MSFVARSLESRVCGVCVCGLCVCVVRCVCVEGVWSVCVCGEVCVEWWQGCGDLWVWQGRSQIAISGVSFGVFSVFLGELRELSVELFMAI